MNTIISNKDEIIMSLVHYFVTEENYTPINVQGAQNEIWLENLEGPYKIVRINSKYIHNLEQYKLDLLRMNFVIKQIKKKTLSLKMNALNICLDLNNSVDLKVKILILLMFLILVILRKIKFLVSYFLKLQQIIFRKLIILIN